MDEDTPLKVTHDVSQSLQRKLEGKQISMSLIQCVDHADTSQALLMWRELTCTSITKTTMTSMRSTSHFTKSLPRDPSSSA
jgi:hypothetical protein